MDVMLPERYPCPGGQAVYVHPDGVAEPAYIEAYPEQAGVAGAIWVTTLGISEGLVTAPYDPQRRPHTWHYPEDPA
jgi:hypothetical protein